MATTFASLRTDVYTITGRSDLVDKTNLAIKSATIKLHSRDHYQRDLYETGVRFDPVSTLQEIDYMALLPRFRKLKYIRKTDSTESLGRFLEILTVEETLDRYAVNKDDVAYVAGSFIKIRSSDDLEYIILGAYLHPDVEEATYSSWIANIHPYAVALEAAKFVFATTGDSASVATIEAELREQRMLIDSYIMEEGF